MIVRSWPLPQLGLADPVEQAMAMIKPIPQSECRTLGIRQ